MTNVQVAIVAMGSEVNGRVHDREKELSMDRSLFTTAEDKGSFPVLSLL